MSPYTKQTWQDYSPNYPVSAARMQHIEDGLYNVTQTAEQGVSEVPVNVTPPTIS